MAARKECTVTVSTRWSDAFSNTSLARLHERNIPFRYEQPLFAGDGTLRLPDFTITWAGKTYFWEHLGRLDLTDYAEEWKQKRAWYERWFPGQLVTTEEGPTLSNKAAELMASIIATTRPTDA